MLSSSQKGKSDSKYYWETSKQQTKESCHATVLIHGLPQTPCVVPPLHLLAQKAYSKNEWDSEKQNKNGQTQTPFHMRNDQESWDSEIRPGKGCLRRIWWRPVESWVARKEWVGVDCPFFQQESWGSTSEADKALMQEDQKMWFFTGNSVGDLTRVCCGY